MELKCEIRSENSMTIEGYVNAICRDSRVMNSPKGRFVEQVKPQVFTRAIESTNEIKVLLNHNRNKELGSTSNGNLILKEDSIGLYAKAEITDNEVIQKAKNKELRGWSFDFIPIKQSWGKTDDPSIERRYLEEIKMSEVSIIDNTMLPCYQGCSIETRAEIEEQIEIRTIDCNIKVDIFEEETRENNTTDLEIKKKKIELLKLKGI